MNGRDAKIGAIVKLRSGGPLMTVSSFSFPPSGATGEQEIPCIWFTESEILNTGKFPVSTLELILKRREMKE